MADPIRIAQVVEAAEGGCKRHVLGLLAGLDPQRFVQTAIVSPWRERDIADQVADATDGRVEAIRWDVRRDLHPWLDFAAYRFLRALFRERDFDVIHCHSAKAGFLGRLAGRGLRAAVLYTPHCFPFMMDVSPLRHRLYLSMERFAGRLTDRLIAVSPSEAEIAARLHVVPEGRIVTVENGIAPQAVPVDAARKRADLGIGADQPVVLSVGALRPQKGYRYLIEAAPEVLATHGDAVFLVAGDGELRPELERLIAQLSIGERVRLLGTRDDVPELLGVAGCFVIPSLWEGGPYALLEAMAAGVPVVGTRIPGVADWLREGETGFAADPAQPSRLAAGITAVLSGPTEARSRAAAARDMVLSRNTEDRWLREMARVYERAVTVT